MTEREKELVELERLRAEEEADAIKKRDDEEYSWDEDCYEAAASKQMCVVFPKFNELQIDIDSGAQYNEFLRRFKYFQEDGALGPMKLRGMQSKSGLPHRHVYVELMDRSISNALTDQERIMLQSAMGDDPLRSFLNTRRLVMGMERPSRLFAKPQNLYYAENGILYRHGSSGQDYIGTIGADEIANQYGFMFVERLITWLEENQGDITEAKKPKPKKNEDEDIPW